MHNWIRKEVWSDSDLQSLHDLIHFVGGAPFVDDLPELIQLPAIQQSITAWYDSTGSMQAVFFVDDYQNLCFETRQADDLYPFLCEILPEASRQAQLRFDDPGLDACESAGGRRFMALTQAGFTESGVRTLKYEYAIPAQMPADCTPAGYRVRPIAGEAEAQAWVDLHDLAVGGGDLDLEYRLAMMRVPGYDRSLDLVLESDTGELAAYCVCLIENENGLQIGYTDPVGVAVPFHRQGLGRAVLTAGVRALMQRGVDCIRLGTSSENEPMQALALAVGFELTSEKIWMHHPGIMA